HENLLFELIRVLGKNFFVKNQIFYIALVESIDNMDDKHMIIADICSQNDIDLNLKDKNFKFFRIVCESRNEHKIKACLAVHTCTNTTIDFSNVKVDMEMAKLKFTYH